MEKEENTIKEPVSSEIENADSLEVVNDIGDVDKFETVGSEENSDEEVEVEKKSEEVNSVETEPKPADVVDVVAIPYINDGENNVQLFQNSVFMKYGNKEDESAVYSAERYFFEKFSNDDEPKWDGVFVCLYNLTKKEIVRDNRNVFVEKREFLKNWIWKNTDSKEIVTFNVKCTMSKVWAMHFQSFLRRMEEFGQIGHSGQISFYSDGGGSFKPKFKFSSQFKNVDGRKGSHITEKAEELFDAC